MQQGARGKSMLDICLTHTLFVELFRLLVNSPHRENTHSPKLHWASERMIGRSNKTRKRNLKSIHCLETEPHHGHAVNHLQCGHLHLEGTWRWILLLCRPAFVFLTFALKPIICNPLFLHLARGKREGPSGLLRPAPADIIKISRQLNGKSRYTSKPATFCLCYQNQN